MITAMLVGVKWYLIVVWFAFPWCLMMLSIFSCAYRPFINLWWSVCRNLLPIFSWAVYLLIIELWNFIYIFWIQVLYHVYVLQIFPPSLFLVFLIFLMMSFEGQKFLILMKSNLLIFFFFGWSTCLVSYLRNLCLTQGHMISSYVFILNFYSFRFCILV